MSLFRFAKYSTILFFLGKYRNKIFRIVAVLLFAAVTSLLYQDVAEYLHREHPGTVIYALVGKIVIVYGALAFVLWQFRPQGDSQPVKAASSKTPDTRETEQAAKQSPLSQLEDINEHDKLLTRYEQLLHKNTKR